MNKEKEIDAVKMMREIREKLSEKYWQHPDILLKDMDAIHKQHNLQAKVSQEIAH